MWTKTIAILGLISLLSFQAHSQDVFEAARTGNIERLKELIKWNKDTIQKVNQMGFDPLMIACYRGQTSCAKFLLQQGANPNRPSAEGSALQAACYQNNTELAALLIKKRANLDAQGPDGNTALMYAVLNQNVKLVKMLVKAGSDLNKKNKDNQTAYTLALSLPNGEIQKSVKSSVN